METLSHILKRLFAHRGSEYYKRMIDDYIEGDWNYNIKQLVSYRSIQQQVPRSFSSRGYKIVRTRVVENTKLFEEKMMEYYNLHIVPMRIVKNNTILAKRTFIRQHGFITEGNQMCQDAHYNCKNCLNFTNGCEIAMKYTKDEPKMKQMTKQLVLLYGNLRKGICEIQVKEGLRYL